MPFFRALFLKPQNPLYSSHKTLSIITRTLASTTQLKPEMKNDENKKSLGLVFKEAVGLCEKVGSSDSVSENSSEFKRNLKDLEREVKELKEKKENGERVQSKERPKSLAVLFRPVPREEALKANRQEKPLIVKELSPDMEMFVRHLYKEGYFKDANFFHGNKLDFQCLDNPYARDFTMSAAERFGRDHQEIAKWLSGSNLRKVALFGCPSVRRKKNVFSAKRLRKFFEIQENTVCDRCVLKSSCKFVNQSVWKGDTKTLNLAVVMRVITLYALDLVPPELEVPDEIRDAVSQLLREVVKLSHTIAQ